jgi:hypothetical protein
MLSSDDDSPKAISHIAQLTTTLPTSIKLDGQLPTLQFPKEGIKTMQMTYSNTWRFQISLRTRTVQLNQCSHLQKYGDHIILTTVLKFAPPPPICTLAMMLPKTLHDISVHLDTKITVVPLLSLWYHWDMSFWHQNYNCSYDIGTTLIYYCDIILLILWYLYYIWAVNEWALSQVTIPVWSLLQLVSWC